MKIKGVTGTGYNQLRWVVLLLAVAVILPTVCLLWFMTQVVRNERLAVKQKLSDAYRQQVEIISRKFNDIWSDQIDILEQQTAATQTPIELFAEFIGRSQTIDSSNVCDTVIIFDNNGKLIYPIIGVEEKVPEAADQLKIAWDLEFNQKRYDRAVELYGQIAGSFVDEYTHYYALMAQVRCLRKAGEIDTAVSLCEKIAYGQNPVDASLSSSTLIARARIQLVELKEQTEEGQTLQDLRTLINSTTQYSADGNDDFILMPSVTRIFLLRKTIEITEASQWAGKLQPELFRAKQLLRAEELASSFLEKYYTGKFSEQLSEENVIKLLSIVKSTVDTIEEIEWGWSEQLKNQISTIVDLSKISDTDLSKYEHRPASTTIFDNWPQHSFRSIDLSPKVFGIHHGSSGARYLLLQKAENFSSDFDLYQDSEQDTDISYRLMDNSGNHACGLENPSKAAFIESPFGKFFPGWSIEVHIRNSDIFEKAASEQAFLYIWAGMLAISVIALAGLLAAQAVGKQIKTNKLKNDFIATVSHELKTPLASMRVLVDTLIEGNYRDQKQVTEYLHLTAQENERLSRLIDNFLSFSRMERNKQAFSMYRTSSVSIAYAAIEAVKTKFGQDQCEFESHIPEDLPDIIADHDAVVTVLVNLLDNACKYSRNEKKIKLIAFARDGSVYYIVSDKGVGMSRRAVKKIFHRFYQIDHSLARNVGGCGLGLSIAKFIVDSHKGTISVESEQGKGSTFIVKLPTYLA